MEVKVHRRWVYRSSYRMALFMLMALRTAERLGGSARRARLGKTLGKAVLVYQAAHGHLLGVHLPALANQPPGSQVRGLHPRDLKRCLIETPSSTQVEQYDLLQKN